ncbi:MAG: sigma factor-like helix-turn-helix DNA-binding protein [Gaiellaceae bacterium]
MATFDQLDPEQRAIIELVLGSGRSYDSLADMLDATPSRVRELARDALGELSPATASRVDPEWRGQLADYVLGQQSGPESTATQGHLKRSEAARTWTYSLLDSLDHLYANGTQPTVPSAGDGASAPPRRERERKRERERPVREKRAEREREREPLRKPAAAEPMSDEARKVVRRRRIIGGAIGLVVLAGVIVGIVALTSGGGSSNKKSPKKASTPVKVLGSIILNPQGGAKARGVAVIAQRGNQKQLIVQAALPASAQGDAYVVWLFNSPQDAISVGAQVADKQGRFQGAGPLPANYQRYKSINVTKQKISANATTYGGTLMLQGTLASLVTPQQVQQQQQQQGQGQTGTGTTPQGGGTGTTPQGGTGTTP